MTIYLLLAFHETAYDRHHTVLGALTMVYTTTSCEFLAEKKIFAIEDKIHKKAKVSVHRPLFWFFFLKYSRHNATSAGKINKIVKLVVTNRKVWGSPTIPCDATGLSWPVTDWKIAKCEAAFSFSINVHYFLRCIQRFAADRRWSSILQVTQWHWHGMTYYKQQDKAANIALCCQ